MLNGKLATILVCAIVGMAFLLVAGGHPASAVPKHPKLFGSVEHRSTKLKKFRKWTGVMARYEREILSVGKKCRVTRRNRCAMVLWRDYLKKIADLPRREQIEKVNSFFNKLDYIVDPTNYGKRDYWATPKQFFNRNGDCEDYAISKYISLRSLGYPIDDMRIAVVNDMNLKIAHAILVVYYKGEALILDNQIDQVINAKRIRHYKPIYSINERSWWLHRG